MTAGNGSTGHEPELFGPYRLEELIGTGGMGEVWRAFDTRRERTVALKRLSAAWAADEELEARFRQEARATARLTSAHVIPIHDFGEIGGRLFVDMRLVPGGDLAAVLAAQGGGGLPPSRAVELLTQVADALASAHAAGMVHRDVKPSNVVLASGTRDFCYLVDFGIAKVAAQTAARPVTRTGTVLGTPAYMAPELFTGASGAGVASDVYALGCVLHEMLTGARPFPGVELAVVMHHHITTPPPEPSEGRPGLAPFDEVVARALAKEPAERYASIEALAEAGRTALASVGPEAREAAPSGAGGAGGGGSAAPSGPESSRPTERPALPARSGPGEPGPPTSGEPGRDPGPDDATVRVGPQARGRRRTWLLAVAAAVVVLAVVATVAVTRSGGTTTAAPAPPRAPSSSTPAPIAPPAPPGPPRTYPVVPTALGAASSGVALSPDGRRLYAAEPGTDQDPGSLLDVANVDPATGAVTQVATVPVGSDPQQVAVSPDGSRAYVTVTGTQAAPGNTVAVVDTRSLTTVASIPVGPDPIAVAVSPDGGRIWVAAPGYDDLTRTLFVIDAATNTVVATPTVGTGARRITFSPDGRLVYASVSGTQDAADDAVAVLDAATAAPQRTLTGPDNPIGVAASPDGREIYAAGGGTGDVPQGGLVAIDLATLAQRPLVDGYSRPLLAGPTNVAIVRDGRTLLASNPGSTDRPSTLVLVVDPATGALRGTADVGSSPFTLAVAPDGRFAYVSTADGLRVVGLA